MRNNNRRLVILVASVAVAAVATGAAFAYRQGPERAQADAAPLAGSPSPKTTPTPTPSASKTPTTAKPTPTTTPTSSPTRTGPIKTKVDLAKLPQGRAPQVTYLSGRTVRGGTGGDVRIPGTEDILDVARINESVLAVVGDGDRSELLRIDPDGKIRRTPDVTEIVSTDDGQAVAYVATRRSDSGAALAGAVVSAERGDQVQKVTVPGVYDAYPLAYVDGKVFYQARVEQAGGVWNLYEWKPGATTTTLLKTVSSPTALSRDGKLAASLKAQSDYNSCTNVVEVATGKRLWRTCEYGVSGFTPDRATAIGQPSYLDGYANGIASALDAENGTLIHEWTGTFRQTVAEDDLHLLILADDGEETPASIIRCTIPTGACELATPLARGNLLIAD